MASAVSQMPVNAAAGLVGLGIGGTETPTRATTPTPRSTATRATDAPYRSPFRVDADVLQLIDQRRLPDELLEQTCRRASDVAFYVRVGAVRGGPLIAQMAAHGLALSAREYQDRAALQRNAELQRVGRALALARPGSRLLRWAVDRAAAILESLQDADGPVIAAALRTDADARTADAEMDHAAIARALAEALPRPEGRRLEVLVHGDPGALTHGILGPLTGALLARVNDGGEVHVWATESRPGMEGARLASWELAMADVPHTLLPDGAVGALLEREAIDAVVLMGDWIAADGSVSALVGSRMVAGIAATTGTDGNEDAGARRVPVLVCAPITTFDPTIADAAALPRDDRQPRDLRLHTTGTRLDRATCWNPGLDVIPAAWIHGYVTEEGVLAPDGAVLAAALARREARRSSPEDVAREALDASAGGAASAGDVTAAGDAVTSADAAQAGDAPTAVGEPSAAALARDA